MESLNMEEQRYIYNDELHLFSILNLQDLKHRRSTNRTQPSTPHPHHRQAALQINIHPYNTMPSQYQGGMAKGWVGDTSVFSNPLLLQFLVKRIPSSHSRDMISIPKEVAHGHPNSECNADIKQDLTTKFSDDGGQIANLVGAGCTRWRRVF